MTKKTRTILFLICFLLFLLITPTVVFYSQGYRFDFENKKITQTGGIFLKVSPKQVEIYLNGKLKEETDFFFGSALIEELSPKKYEVKIKKEGYHFWQKNLEIKEKQVTEAKNIVLIPENPNFNILGKGIDDFYFSPNEKKIILKEIEEKGWALKLYDIERKVKSHLIGEEDISKTEVDLLNLNFSADAKKIFLEVGTEEQLKHFTLEIDKIPVVLTESEKPWPPLKTSPPSNIITYQIVGEDIYYLDNSGHLFKSDFSFEPKIKITEVPFPVQQETEYQLKVFSDFVFLKENQILYQFNPSSKSFEKVFEPVKGLIISPDFKKIVYFNDYEIWILFLKEVFDQPQKKAGEQLFLTRFSEKIGQIFWYTSHYLIFNVGNKIKVAEIDDRDGINIYDIAEFKNPKIFWTSIQPQRLYVLSNENLYFSEPLLK
ncbi:MAG: hypothetical protein QME61_00290 [Patescibacteria group bacterium]|nr:hypothetical protein [Patescibacteria group bacterium]